MTITFTTFSNIINGALTSTPSTTHSINPATLSPLPPVPLATPTDIDAAISSATRAAQGWEDTPLQERRQCVLKYAGALEALSEEFARMLVLECGKPVRLNARGLGDGS